MAPAEEVLSHHAIRRLAELSADRDDLLVSVVEPADGTILWCSERGLRNLVGRELDEVIGKSTCTFVPADDLQDWHHTRAVAAAGQTVLADREIEHPEEGRVRLTSTAWRVDGDRGPVVALTVAPARVRRP